MAWSVQTSTLDASDVSPLSAKAPRSQLAERSSAFERTRSAPRGVSSFQNWRPVSSSANSSSSGAPLAGVMRTTFEWGRIQSNADWILPIGVCIAILLFGLTSRLSRSMSGW